MKECVLKLLSYVTTKIKPSVFKSLKYRNTKRYVSKFATLNAFTSILKPLFKKIKRMLEKFSRIFGEMRR